MTSAMNGPSCRRWCCLRSLTTTTSPATGELPPDPHAHDKSESKIFPCITRTHALCQPLVLFNDLFYSLTLQTSIPSEIGPKEPPGYHAESVLQLGLEPSNLFPCCSGVIPHLLCVIEKFPGLRPHSFSPFLLSDAVGLRQFRFCLLTPAGLCGIRSSAQSGGDFR